MLRATAHAPPGVVQRERHVATVAICAGMFRLEHLLHEAGGSLCVPALAPFSCFRVGGCAGASQSSVRLCPLAVVLLTLYGLSLATSCSTHWLIVKLMVGDQNSGKRHISVFIASAAVPRLGHRHPPRVAAVRGHDNGW